MTQLKIKISNQYNQVIFIRHRPLLPTPPAPGRRGPQSATSHGLGQSGNLPDDDSGRLLRDQYVLNYFS
ncbi:hypothetical protein G5714_009050 [Onychostoma macrolepis]|uniref:Uncharacterized protein n=1 Tax=Onychostoma macrolepis TaxID=369639 RepID=A0A7J6CR30_9TELE|nr:hypothetical protein G5714_009050 [Onychostoma macrolepis]